MSHWDRSVNGTLGKRNTSGVSGVSRVTVGKYYGQWTTSMRITGYRLYLGIYETLEEAEAVMIEARKRKAVSDGALLDWYDNELECDTKGVNPFQGYNRR